MDVPKKEIFMYEALQLAIEASKKDEVPVGAILVCQGEVLSIGRNRREETHRTASHAEIEALEAYNLKSGQWRLPPETTLFVTVEPCLMCTGAMLWARLDHMVYGCADTKHAGLERVRPLIEEGVYDHKFQSIEAGILGKKCSAVMTKYFRGKREANLKRPQRQPAQTAIGTTSGT